MCWRRRSAVDLSRKCRCCANRPADPASCDVSWSSSETGFYRQAFKSSVFRKNCQDGSTPRLHHACGPPCNVLRRVFADFSIPRAGVLEADTTQQPCHCSKTLPDSACVFAKTRTSVGVSPGDVHGFRRGPLESAGGNHNPGCRWRHFSSRGAA